jgi:hypothetical protein
MNPRPQQCRDRCCDNGKGRQDKRRKSQTDTLALSPEFSEDRIALSLSIDLKIHFVMSRHSENGLAGIMPAGEFMTNRLRETG